MAKTETIELSMYDGQVSVVFYPNSHQYKVNGVNVKSPSSILWIVDKSQPLIYWATNLARDYLLERLETGITKEDIISACLQHKEKKEEAADIWSQAHEWIENYTRDKTISLPEDERVQNIINEFINREKQHNIQFLEFERVVYSRNHNYIGTLDAIAFIDWKKYLIDYKTSNKIYLSQYGMQTTAYKVAYEEETGEKLDGIIIIKLPKDQVDKDWNHLTFEVQEIHDFDWFFQWFLHAKGLKELVDKYK